MGAVTVKPRNRKNRSWVISVRSWIEKICDKQQGLASLLGTTPCSAVLHLSVVGRAESTFLPLTAFTNLLNHRL